MIPNYKSNVITSPSEGTETDILHKLRQAISNQQIPMPISIPKIPKIEYDENILNNIGKNAGEILDQVRAESQERAAAQMRAESEAKNANAQKNAGRGFNMKNTGKDNLLEMIFKIVPIGINVIKKGKTLAEGLKQTSLGLVNLVKNLAISSAILSADAITFAFQSAYYYFKVMLCAIGGLSNLHKCILFFLIDLIVFLFLLVITSVLFLIDTFFRVKSWTGISSVEMLAVALDGIEEFDKFVYSLTSIHPFHYPDMITKMCYTCSAMGDTSGYKAASKKMYKDVFVMVPDKIGSPFGDIVRGVGKVFDLFNV